MNFLNLSKCFFGSIYEKIHGYCLVNEYIQERKTQQLKRLQPNNFNKLFYKQKNVQVNNYLRECTHSRYSFQNNIELPIHRRVSNEFRPIDSEYNIYLEKTQKQSIDDYDSNFWSKLNQKPNKKNEIERKHFKNHVNTAKHIIPMFDLKSIEKRNSDLLTYRENFSVSNKKITPIFSNLKNKTLESRRLQSDWINLNMLLLSACHDRTIQNTKAKIEMLTFYTLETNSKYMDSKLHIIEEGSFGKVYKGRYNGFDVAVKVPNLYTMKSDPFGVTDRILREWKILAKISHPNIIGFRGGIILPNKHIWLITELIQGCDLHSLKYKFKYEIPREKAIKMIKQLTRALDFLHTPMKGKGIIIHRDIKPENIIIDNINWNAYLCDFGDAEEFGSGNKRKLSGATWLYSPIELLGADPMGNHIPIQSVSQYNEKWDIWSFGCVLQEFFGNANPFEYIIDFTDDSNQIYLKLVKAVKENKYIPNIPTNIHPQIKKIIEMCLQPDPRLRPNTKVILKMIDKII